MTKLAAELIGQGLYDFAAITLVGCGALIAYLTITVVTYQAMALNCLAAISAALAGGVFRETARAASTMKGVYELEEHFQQSLRRQSFFDTKYIHPDRITLSKQQQQQQQQQQKQQDDATKSENVADVSFDLCYSGASRVEVIRDAKQHDEESRSGTSYSNYTDSLDGQAIRQAGTPEAVLSFDRYLPSSSKAKSNRFATRHNH